MACDRLFTRSSSASVQAPLQHPLGLAQCSLRQLVPAGQQPVPVGLADQWKDSLVILHFRPVIRRRAVFMGTTHSGEGEVLTHWHRWKWTGS